MLREKLIELLKKFSPKTDVRVTWEGQVIDINPENIYRDKEGRVIIDADSNYYKKDLEGKRK